jgi:hypothetical protein
VGGGHGGGEPGPGDTGPGWTGQDGSDSLGQPRDDRRVIAPQPGEPVDLDLEQAERRVGRVGRPGEAGAEDRQALERGLDSRRIRLR